MATTETRVREQGVIIEGQHYNPTITHRTCDVCVTPLEHGSTVYVTADGRSLVCLACGNRLDSSAQADAQAGGDA